MTMMKKPLLSIVAAGAFALGLGSAAEAAEKIELPEVKWSFEGVFGTFDRAQLQRGLQVYKEVCSACHSLHYIAFRNLHDLGYSEDEIKAFAATYQVQNEEPNDQGEMFMRPARDSDRFPRTFPNEQAARAANGGAYPPDLSLMTKAREGGPEYLHALMVGYTQAPSNFKLLEGLYYNAYFPGHQIAMPPPLNPGQVTYADGTEASVDQMAKDVSAFLTWTAEPKMEARKAMGIKVMLFLLVATGLLIAVKKRIWRNMH